VTETLHDDPPSTQSLLVACRQLDLHITQYTPTSWSWQLRA